MSRSEVSAQREIRRERGRVTFGESLKLLVIIIIINIWHSEASPYLSLSPPTFLSHVAFNIFYSSRPLPAHPSWFLTFCLSYHLFSPRLLNPSALHSSVSPPVISTLWLSLPVISNLLLPCLVPGSQPRGAAAASQSSACRKHQPGELPGCTGGGETMWWW